MSELRPCLRRRLAHALSHTAHTTCTIVGAITITALPLAALLPPG